MDDSIVWSWINVCTTLTLTHVSIHCHICVTLSITWLNDHCWSSDWYLSHYERDSMLLAINQCSMSYRLGSGWKVWVSTHSGGKVGLAHFRWTRFAGFQCNNLVIMVDPRARYILLQCLWHNNLLQTNFSDIRKQSSEHTFICLDIPNREGRLFNIFWSWTGQHSKQYQKEVPVLNFGFSTP